MSSWPDEDDDAPLDEEAERPRGQLALLEQKVAALKKEVALLEESLIDADVRDRLLERFKWLKRFAWIRSLIRIVGVMAGTSVFTWVAWEIFSSGVGDWTGALCMLPVFLVPEGLFALLNRTSAERTRERIRDLRLGAKAEPLPPIEVDVAAEPLNYRSTEEAPASRGLRLQAELAAFTKRAVELRAARAKEQELERAFASSDGHAVLRSLGVPVWVWPMLGAIFTLIVMSADILTERLAEAVGWALVAWLADSVFRAAINWRALLINKALREELGELPRSALKARVAPANEQDDEEDEEVLVEESAELEDPFDPTTWDGER